MSSKSVFNINCPKCGKENPDYRSVCFYCETPLDETATTDKSNDKKVKATTPFTDLSSPLPVKEKFEYVSLPPTHPSYLGFLRVIGGVNLVVGILALIAFVINLYKISSSSSTAPPSYIWAISLSIALEGFLAYGLLNAIADIAENMIDVGYYVRSLKKDARK